MHSGIYTFAERLAYRVCDCQLSLPSPLYVNEFLQDCMMYNLSTASVHLVPFLAWRLQAEVKSWRYLGIFCRDAAVSCIWSLVYTRSLNATGPHSVYYDIAICRLLLFGFFWLACHETNLSFTASIYVLKGRRGFWCLIHFVFVAASSCMRSLKCRRRVTMTLSWVVLPADKVVRLASGPSNFHFISTNLVMQSFLQSSKCRAGL